jgi:predicted RNA-binding protein YlxR (DUF448 family)
MPTSKADVLGPARRCILSGERLQPDELIRFAVTASGDVVPDPGRLLGGRGLWLAPQAGWPADAAVLRKAFARAARRGVKLPADLPAVTLAAHEAHCAELARRVARAGLQRRPEAPLCRRLQRDLACLARLRGQA